MQIEDFKKADCTRFRLPTLDLSNVQGQLDAIILKAWENGLSAEQAVEHALTQEEILNQLVGQIEGNLNFRQKVELDNVAAETNAKVSQYEEEKEKKLEQVMRDYEERTKANQEELATTLKEIQERNQAYSAAQARLEEMRARVQSRVRGLGGEKKVGALLTIQEALSKESSPAASAYSGQAKTEPLQYKEKLEEKATETGAAPEVSPLEKEEKERKQEEEEVGFFQKVWKVLNYKIW